MSSLWCRTAPLETRDEWSVYRFSGFSSLFEHHENVRLNESIATRGYKTKFSSSFPVVVRDGMTDFKGRFLFDSRVKSRMIIVLFNWNSIVSLEQRVEWKIHKKTE